MRGGGRDNKDLQVRINKASKADAVLDKDDGAINAFKTTMGANNCNNSISERGRRRRR